MVFYGYSNNKANPHEIADILLKVASITTTLTLTVYQGNLHRNNKLLNIVSIQNILFYWAELTDERPTDVSVQLYITEIYDVNVAEMVRSYSL